MPEETIGTLQASIDDLSAAIDRNNEVIDELRDENRILKVERDALADRVEMLETKLDSIAYEAKH